MHNNASIGAAIYAGDKGCCQKHYGVSLIDVKVIENVCMPCTHDAKGAVVYCKGTDYLNISSSSYSGSQFIGNYPQGSIQGIGANLHLSGMVSLSFQNNSGVNGSAIYLTNDAHLYFHENCTVYFSDNIATIRGGAIYIEGDLSKRTHNLSSCAVHFIGNGNYSIAFQGNHANIAGDSIYATPIYDCLLESNRTCNSTCYPTKRSDYDTYYMMHDSSNNHTTNSQLLSFPVKLDLSYCRYGNTWAGPTSNNSEISLYPGATLQCNATLMDYAGSMSPSLVFAEVGVMGGHCILPDTRVRLAFQQRQVLLYGIISLSLYTSSWYGIEMNTRLEYCSVC